MSRIRTQIIDPEHPHFPVSLKKAQDDENRNPMMAWAMLVPRMQTEYRKAEPPCWKGELVLPLLKWSLVLGWQRKATMDKTVCG